MLTDAAAKALCRIFMTAALDAPYSTAALRITPARAAVVTTDLASPLRRRSTVTKPRALMRSGRTRALKQLQVARIRTAYAIKISERRAKYRQMLELDADVAVKVWTAVCQPILVHGGGHVFCWGSLTFR
jgi:hypothetical protein